MNNVNMPVSFSASLEMDPRKLLYFAAVIETGSLTKAAKSLAVSQPALSKSMDRLEKELGTKLLIRSPFGVSPTRLGELIYSHARLIKDEMFQAEQRLSANSSNSHVLSVGVLPSLAGSVLARGVSRWRDSQPEVALKVVEKVQVELILGVLKNEFDFIIAQTEYYDLFLDGLKQRVLFRDRLHIFANSHHDLCHKEAVSWADIAAYPWVSPMVGWPQRAILEKIVAEEGISQPHQLIECGSIEFTKSLIANSNHLALLPAHTVDAEVKAGAIQALSLSIPAMKRDIAVIFRERTQLDEVAQTLIEHIREAGILIS